MKMSHLLAWVAATGLAALLTSGVARAETREIAANTLVLTASTSADMTIGVDHGLTGHVRVSLEGSLDCLSITGGPAAVISTSSCSEDDGNLHIDVPPDMPLTLSSNGDGNIRLGDTNAPVTVTMNGSGNLVGGRVGRLVLGVRGSSDVTLGAVPGGAILDMAGSGDVRLASVGGALVLKHHGSGDLAVGHIDAPALEIESSGSGDMLIGDGNIHTLVAHMQGDGDLAVAAPVQDADISAYGGGDVKLGVVSGTMHRASGDGSDIIIGGPALVNTIIGKVANAVGKGHNHVVVESNDLGHVLTFLAICAMAFIGWRIVHRGRRLPAEQPGAVHPGVVAVTETLKRVEDRLGRVEGYVTSREFDLQQKFKQL